jgi:hypothetical protein
MAVAKETARMKWQSVIPRSLALALALCAVSVMAQPTWPSPPTGLHVQPSGSGTTTVVPNAVIATSCSQAHVETALSAVTAGGTVLIPAGTCTWTTGIDWLTMPANVTIQGAGDLTTLGGDSDTVIIDSYQSSNPLIRLTASATGVLRVTGLTFQGGSSGDNIKVGGVIAFSSATQSTIRLDHSHFINSTYSTVYGRAGSSAGFSGTYGVVDNNIFDESDNAVRIFGVPSSFQRWADPTGLGGSDFLFFEDNDFIEKTANDCQGAGKFVFRYNTFTSSGIQVHPTGAQHRGCRAWEIYGNTFQGLNDPPSYVVFFVSSGVGVVWGNSVTTEGYKNFIAAYSMRRNDVTYTATATPNGWGYCGPGRASGTVNVSSGAGTTLTRASGDNFNTTDWPADSMIFVDGASFEVASVESTTSLTIRQANQGPLPSTKAGLSGVAYSVGSNWDGNTSASTGWPCMDQPGQGQGDLLTGEFPNVTNSATGCISTQSCAWPRQALEPTREWLNLPFTPAPGYGGSFFTTTFTDVLQADRDYYIYTASFTGASGIGSGARSSRPSTCTTGTAWWSTDQGGNWNTSNGGANDGTLDVCTATNTWTNASYTPYTYPHPLRTN